MAAIGVGFNLISMRVLCVGCDCTSNVSGPALAQRIFVRLLLTPLVVFLVFLFFCFLEGNNLKSRGCPFCYVQRPKHAVFSRPGKTGSSLGQPRQQTAWRTSCVINHRTPLDQAEVY